MPSRKKQFFYPNGGAQWPTIGQGGGVVSDGFDYHVDSAAAGGGTGTLAAPLTLTELYALVGSLANKKIAFKKGSTFNQAAVAISDNGVTIDAYGTGSNPIFDCRATSSGNWTNVATNVWQKTFTQESNAKASGNFFKDGVPMILVQNRAALTTLGQAFVTAWGWNGTGITATTSLVVEIYSTVQPNGDGSTYSYSRYLYGLRITGNSPTVKNITLKGPLHQDGALTCEGTGTTTWDGVRSEWGSRHNAYSGASLVASNCYFYGGRNRQEFNNGNAVVIFLSGGITALTASFTSCTFDGAGIPASTETFDALYAHDAGSGKLLSATFTSCTFMGKANGMGGKATTVTFTGCTLTGVRTLIESDGGAGCTFNVTSCTGTLDQLCRNSDSSGTITIVETDNTFTCAFNDLQDSTKCYLQGAGAAAVNWTQTRVSITNSGVAGDNIGISLINGAATIAKNNCVFTGPNWDFMDAYVGASYTLSGANDNNQYKVTGGVWYLTGSFTTYNGLAAWKTQNPGKEVNSTAA